MKKLGIYILSVLVITILLPTVIVKTFNFASNETVIGEDLLEGQLEQAKKKKDQEKLDRSYDMISVYNGQTKQVEKLSMNDYVKGVVAAEMPAEFHMEALKAQAVAARTYAIYRSIKYKDGHPDHGSAPLCDGVHCQAYLSFSDLEDRHGDNWIEKYWPKIQEAVDRTTDLVIYYNEEIIEPLYHSTSGGRTENVIDVFAVDLPYLKSVSSPYEEEAPRFKSNITLSIDDFVGKIKSKYPEVNINKENIHDKIKLIDKTMTGRIKTIAIDENIIEGRELRELFELNSTNFTISLDKKLNIIEIETYGYGHGVGMSQWSANGLAKNGRSFEEILKHFYTGVEVKAVNSE